MIGKSSPAFMVGGFSTAVGVYQILEQLEGTLKTGEGIGWGEHDNRMFCGVERFFGPSYRASLAGDWIKSLDGVEDKLRAGAKVADVGCGHGATAILIAQAYPNTHVYGFDVHMPSIEVARQRADAAGVGDRVTFARTVRTPSRMDLRIVDLFGTSGGRVSVDVQIASDSMTWGVAAAPDGMESATPADANLAQRLT